MIKRLYALFLVTGVGLCAGTDMHGTEVPKVDAVFFAQQPGDASPGTRPRWA